jgi:hypothetical protein
VLHLRAAVFSVYTPLTEVLAVVAEEPIAVFSEPGACPPHDLRSLQSIGPSGSDPYGVSVSEARERSLFHRSAVPVLGKSGVMHDGAAAHIDTVMRIGETRRDEVRAQRGLFMRRKQPIASANATQGLVAGARSGVTTRLEVERLAEKATPSGYEPLTLRDVHDGLVLRDMPG